jgi:hypothetical protein
MDDITYTVVDGLNGDVRGHLHDLHQAIQLADLLTEDTGRSFHIKVTTIIYKTRTDDEAISLRAGNP